MPSIPTFPWSLIEREIQSTIEPSSRAILQLWHSFQIIGGHILLPILVIVFCFSIRAKRHPTLVNLCLTWVIAGIGANLLLYTGTEEGPEPPPGLCLAQASILYGITPMGGTAVLALVLQVFFDISSSTTSRLISEDPDLMTLRTTGLVISPYVLFSIFATSTAWIGFNNPTDVNRSRRFFYCSLRNNYLTDTMAVVVAVLLLVSTFFEGWIALILYRNWTALRNAGSRTPVDVSLILRVMVFGVYVVVGACLSLLSILSPRSVVPDLWLASVGVVVALIFGTQRNVFLVFAFWKADAEPTKVAHLPHGERKDASFLA